MTDFNETPEQARKLWIDALRSGNYDQTQGMLHRTSKEERDLGEKFTIEGDSVGYCCLGVACDLFNQAEPECAVEVEINEEENGLSYGGSDGLLPLPVQRWLGLLENDGSYCIAEGNEFTDVVPHSLTSDNDNGKTFDEIADIIESGSKGMFQ